MRMFFAMVAAAAMAFAGVARAEELKSGLQPGEGIGAFDVEKCGGAADDGMARFPALAPRVPHHGQSQSSVTFLVVQLAPPSEE